MKTLLGLASILLICASSSKAANILWVSDAPAPEPGFSGPGTNMSDQGFITLLQAAGHNVNRYNPPNAAATALTADELLAINTNDLVILGKAITSNPFTGTQGAQWNASVTVPLLSVNAYLTRQNRLGWFTANNIPDSTVSRLTAAVTNSLTEYLFSDVLMSGNTTVDLYDQLLDRNTTHITDPLVAGGVALATTTFVRDDGGGTATAIAIAELPAGTTVRGTDILPAYRLYFSTSHRESSTAPSAVSTHTGRETLSPAGENVFLKAVQLALNSGIAPVSTEQMTIVEEPPAEITLTEGESLRLIAEVTGNGPRTLAWQRDSGDGLTFTNIPEATTPFSSTVLEIPAVTAAENGARFRIYAEDALDSTTSQVVNLTVLPDTDGPILRAATSADGQTVTAFFNELLDSTRESVTDPINFQITGQEDVFVTASSLLPDGKSVLLNLSALLTNSSFSLQVEGVMDQFGNVIESQTQVGFNLALTSATIGALNPPGTNVAGQPIFLLGGSPQHTFEISAGGLDIVGASDQLQFGYKAVEGDFDATVRIISLQGTNRHESNAKVVLSARESLDTGSRAVTIYATPPAPADDRAAMLVRTIASTPPATNWPAILGGGATNIFLRIKREGNQFTTYLQQTGEWIEVGTTNVDLPATLLVGVGAVSHRNTQFTTARFTEFNIQTGSEPQPVTLLNPSYNNGSFSFSFQGVANARYAVEYKDSLEDAEWTEMPEFLTGTGDVQTVVLDGSAAGTRFYRVRSL